MKNNKLSILLRGIIKENPVLVLVLGTCPTLAVTSSVLGAVSMGVAALFVLVCSNMAISAMRRIIPDSVRIPCYIVIIAGFVTIVKLIVKAYLPDINDLLGSYLDLIVVNCIILGRAEAYANKHTPLLSVMDGLGMGIGFTITLTIMGSIREILGSGTWMSGLDGILPFLPDGFAIKVLPIEPFTIMTSAPGGFFVFGVLMAGATWLTSRPKKAKAVEAAEEGGNA